jgi:hypothetical protein
MTWWCLIALELCKPFDLFLPAKDFHHPRNPSFSLTSAFIKKELLKRV